MSRRGKKIEKLCDVFCILGIMGSLVGGGIILGSDSDFAVIGIVVMVLGTLSTLLSYFVLRGFVELLNNVEAIKQNLESKVKDPTISNKE